MKTPEFSRKRHTEERSLQTLRYQGKKGRQKSKNTGLETWAMIKSLFAGVGAHSVTHQSKRTNLISSFTMLVLLRHD